LEEIQKGDRASICGLLDVITLMSDTDRLKALWRLDAYHSSYDAMIPTVFDDLRIRDRAAMPNGYLGTYNGFGADLAALADALDQFDEWWSGCGKGSSDLEILTAHRWSVVVNDARRIVHNVGNWRKLNCCGMD